MGRHWIQRTFTLAILVGLALSTGSVGSASAGSQDATDDTQMVDGGSWYLRQQWPHDGSPFECEHFVV